MLESHANLGEMLTQLYGESAFRLYITEVGRWLAQTSVLRHKIESLQTTVRRMTEQTTQQVAQMKVLASERHTSRVFYDHYRGKVAKLERTHGNTSDAKKHEKYTRNQNKYREARNKYEKDNRQLMDLLEAVTTKIEVILGEVCFRFTQEVEVQFYAEIARVFAGLSDFEERMKQIAI
jgi:predicted  nucleic acid-binding Zn-ribbon protein